MDVRNSEAPVEEGLFLVAVRIVQHNVIVRTVLAFVQQDGGVGIRADDRIAEGVPAQVTHLVFADDEPSSFVPNGPHVAS